MSTQDMPRGMILIAVLTVLILEGTDAARILGIFPVPVKSHMHINSALVRELAKRGHQVTIFSPFPENPPVPNITDVEFKVTYPELLQDSGTPNMFDADKLWFHQMLNMLWSMGIKICDKMFATEFMQKLIHATESEYDLLIIGAFFNDCAIALKHKLKIPAIQLCSFGGTMWMHDWVGNPNTFSYIPDPFRSFTHKMNFWERMVNMDGSLYIMLGRYFYFIPEQDAVVRKHFNDNDMPSISDIETSLVLVNNHFTINYPRPLVPNFVQVGGMHIKPPKKLPQDLEKFISESEHGVIYFSMGSNLKGSNMPPSASKAFLEAFSKVKQRILWKWEEDTLPGLPQNVKLGKWLPQSDILAHANVKMFMTHGGLLSTQETIYHGVPVIGMPIYGDQSLNMARSVSEGFGVLLDFKTNITTESVLWAINEVVGNPRYHENAQRLSRIFRDQPLTPLEQAVFWTEYVIRHKGAPHMRSAALDLTWYQYFLLDVIGVLLLAIVTVLFILIVIFRTIYSKCSNYFCHKPVTSNKKSN